MGPHSRATVTARTGALVGLGSLALLIRRATEMAGALDDSWRGHFLARLDSGAVIVVAGLCTMLYRPWARAHLSGTRPPSARRWWWDCARHTYPWWWLAVVTAGALLGITGGPRQLAITAVLFRDPRPAGPLAGLSVGWILFVVAGVGLLLPAWSWLVRRAGPVDLRREHSLTGGLAVAGVLIRAGLGAVGADANYGVISWLPAQLAPVAVGFWLATMVEARRLDLARARPDKRWVMAAGAATAAAWFMLVSVSGVPMIEAPNGPWRLIVGHVLATVVAGGLGWGLLNAPNRFLHPLTVCLATVAPGILLFHEAILDLIARQYRERVTGSPGERVIDGSPVALIVWSTVVCAAIGVVLVAAYLFGSARRRRSVEEPIAWRFAVSAIGATAFIWRFAALLAIAPERTDGGDPLFYHTTANLLAEGQGFLEPLNWIAHGERIASALHGPLYPMVLSASSRFGGTSFFDHKMVSLLIGSATAIAVAHLGRRLAGARAGLLGAVFVVVYPNLWVIDGVLFPEGLFALLTTSSVLVVYRWRSRGERYSDAAIAGALVGLAALTRGEGLLLGPLMIAPFFLLHRPVPIRRRIVAVAVAAGACVALIAPWAIRNSARFEVAVPLSTNGNELLVYANCDETYSGKFLGFWLFDCQDQLRAEIGGDPPGDEAEKSVYWRKRGITYALEHAAQLPKVVAARVGRQWELFRPWQNTEFAAIEGRSVGWARVGLVMYYGLAVAAIAGWLALRRRRVATWPIVAQFVSVTVTAAYAYGTTRFRAPAEPMLCLLAGVGAMPLVGRARDWMRGGLDRISDPAAFVLGTEGAAGRRPRLRHRISAVAPIFAVAAVVAAPLRGLYRSSGSTMEEGFMLTFPERVMAGDVPNVDFLHLYGPGSLDLLAATYSLFGVRLGVERTFGLAQHLLIIFGIYALTRAWGRLAAAGCAVLSAILVLTPIGLSALAWNGGVGLGLWSVVCALRARHASTHRRRWEFAAGALGGLALTFRPDLAVTLGATHLFLLWRRRSAWRSTLIGAFVGAIPMWRHLVRAGFGPSWQGMFADPVFELRPGRELPRPPAWDYFQGALQVIADKFPPWWEVPHIGGPRQLFLWFFLLPVAALAVLGIAIAAHRWSDDERRTRTLVAVAIFGVGLLPQAFQRPDSAHFAWVSCVSLAVAPVAIAEGLRLRRAIRPRGRILTGLAAIAAVYLVVFPFFSYRGYLNNVRQSLGQVSTGLEVRRGDRTFILGDTRPWRAAQQVIDDLDRRAMPGERLLVGPVDLRQTVYSDVFFYYLFPELKPATYYIEMDPGLADRPGSRLASDVESADWLLLTRYWSGWIEPNTSTVFGDDRPNQVVEEQFCLVGSYENDLIRLYHRCAGGDGVGPYEGPYEPAYDYAVEVSVPVPPRPDGTSPFEPGPFQPLIPAG